MEKVTIQGIITAINDNKAYPSIQINGTNTNGIVLNIDEQTVIQDSKGYPFAFKHLMIGMKIEAQHRLAMTMSLPPQTYAFTITVLT